MKNATRETKRLERFAQIKGWKKSGLSKEAYSKQIGLPNNTFYYWEKQYLASQGKEPEERSEAASTESSFIQLPVQNIVKESSYELLFPNGMIVKIKGELSIGLLKKIKDA